MKREDRLQLAHDLFYHDHNCAQAVVLAFEDVLPLKREELERISVAFGAGYSKTHNTCGSVSGIGIVVGLLDQTGDERSVYQKVNSLVNNFKEVNGSDNCNQLLRDSRRLTAGYQPPIANAEYYNSRPCVKFVLECVDLLAEEFDL